MQWILAGMLFVFFNPENTAALVEHVMVYRTLQVEFESCISRAIDLVLM